MNKRTLIEELVDHSVWVNGLLVPGASVERTLARHAVSLIAHNDDDTFKVSLIGSATAVHFRSRYILLCSAHQLHGIDPQRVAMLKDDGSYVVTSGGYRSFAMSGETDAYDIAAFDFTEPVAAHPDFRKRFFSLSEVPPDTANVNIMAMLLTGYPSKKQAYEIAEANHLGFARLQVVCLPDGQPSDPALLRMRATSPLAVDPDGMSGGPAFVVQLVGGECRAYFAGIVLRGGSEVFHVLKPGNVVMFLERTFSSGPTA